MILPGLVNAHSHLEYAVYAGFGDGEVFGDWLGTHISRKRALEYDDMVAIARRGAADSLAAGRDDDGRLQLLGRLRRRRRRSSACARSSTSRSSAPTRSRPPATSTSCARRVAESELVQHRRLAPRALHLLARRLPLVPLARHPGRHAPRRERGGERVARLRHRAARGDRPVPRPADRPARRRRRSRRCSGPNFSARTASTSTMTRSSSSPTWTFRSRTARAPMRCSAAAPRRSPACARPASAWGSAPTRRPRPRRSTSGRSCAPPWYMSRAREQRPDALDATRRAAPRNPRRSPCNRPRRRGRKPNAG